MARIWRLIGLAAVLILPAAILFSGGAVKSAPNALEISAVVPTITSGVNPTELEVPVYVENFQDSIAGVQLWFNLSNTDLCKFVVDSVKDTTYYAKYDTSGTLLSGFEFVQARIRDGANSGVFSLVGTADNGTPPTHSPIAPQGGEIPLVKIFIQVQPNLGDTLCVDSLNYGEGYDVQIEFNDLETKFSDPDKYLLGYTCEPPTIDTIYTNCAQFVNDSCVSWFDTTYVPHEECNYDSSKISYVNGLVQWTCGLCGDADGSGNWSIGDAVYLINYIFGGGPPPDPPSNGDADGSGGISIGDAVYLINYIFGGGPPPTC